MFQCLAAMYVNGCCVGSVSMFLDFQVLRNVRGNCGGWCGVGVCAQVSDFWVDWVCMGGL